MSDDLVKQLRNDSGREVCKRDMPDFPCAALCPCALELRILADADELDRLRAENARLREALIDAADMLSGATFEVMRVRGQYIDRKDVVCRARAALQTEGGE